jgi:putative heme-binding domain-containing protein
VRDLFEGYFPPDPSGERKLGTSPRPKTILAHQGDAARGEKLFWSEAVNCGKCHQIENRGTAVGPDLSMIGKLRTPEDLLESLLTPSRRVEPKFTAYQALTEDGQTVTGVLASRSQSQVVLRDGQGKTVTLDAKNVQRLQPSRMSLMPDGQMAGLTAQQAADLLAYLASRRSEPAGGTP